MPSLASLKENEQKRQENSDLLVVDKLPKRHIIKI